jgi:hypothetical protein
MSRLVDRYTPGMYVLGRGKCRTQRPC